MHDLLNHYPVYFPKRNDQLYTLKQFIEISSKSQLPIIVNIASSNHYGRALKHFLTKNTHLLLIGVYQFDSVLAEYHGTLDGRRHSHRHRMNLTQGKITTKASTRFRTMRKFSKSLASLTTLNNQSNTNFNNNNNEEEEEDEDDDADSYHQRSLAKTLNEKRSSAIPFCRIPIHYPKLFELLNENDQSVEPYHKLTDLILPGYPEKRIEKWPRAFFLRSSCTAYTQKNTPEYVYSANGQKSNSIASNDSCYSSSSDLNSTKNLIVLKDEAVTLQAGQVLNILGDCIALQLQIVEKEIKEQQQPPLSPSPTSMTPPLSPFALASNWFREKSKIFFLKKRRSSPSSDFVSSEISSTKSISNKYEPYLKCQTEQGEIVYLPLHESGVFSPIYYPTSSSKSDTDASPLDISEVYHLKHLISNFRFPISVRHLEGSINFNNIYSPASIQRNEIATKLRLLMRYNEEVVFACPVNAMSSKSYKTSPCIVIPLSINADIEIQPCINMPEISKREEFLKLLDTCFQLIEQYQNEISLIHFPIQINNTNRRRETLYMKRSQSESFIGCADDTPKCRFRYSDERLSYPNEYTPDLSISSISTPLSHRNSTETLQQKVSNETASNSIQRSDNYSKTKFTKQARYPRDGFSSDDEIYQDVDKIYDYIRSGDVTDDVRRIQAKEKMYHSTQGINLLGSTHGVCFCLFVCC